MSESSVRESQRRSYSCMTCKQRKVKCDKKLPCNQCLARGLAHECQREIVRVKGQITEDFQQPTYDHLVKEVFGLKAELTRQRIFRYPKPDIVTPVPLDDSIEQMERRLLRSTRSTDRVNTVEQIKDILTPSRKCSEFLLVHGELWISWMHFALHSPTFALEHREFWDLGGQLQPQSKDESLWLAIYFSYLCGVVLLLSEEEAANADLPGSDLSFVMINWYNAALFYLNQGDFLRNHHIRSVQAVAVLSIVFNNIKDTNFQESLLASAIRIGQALNLDQDSSNIHESFVQRETRRRAWWTLIICEWLATPRRPSCVSELDFDVALPSVVTDDEIFPEGIRLHYPQQHPRPIQYHIAMAKTALVYHRFNSLLRLAQWDTSHMTSAVMDADQELAYIIDDLHSHLQADEVQTWKTSERDLQHPWIVWQKASLSTVLLYYRSVINRTLQPHWLKGENVQARTSSICIGSARAILSNLQTDFIKQSRWRPWAITFKVFSAALTLVREMKKSEETHDSHAEIEFALQFLSAGLEDDLFASTAAEFLREYMSIDE